MKNNTTRFFTSCLTIINYFFLNESNAVKSNIYVKCQLKYVYLVLCTFFNIIESHTQGLASLLRFHDLIFILIIFWVVFELLILLYNFYLFNLYLSDFLFIAKRYLPLLKKMSKFLLSRTHTEKYFLSFIYHRIKPKLTHHWRFHCLYPLTRPADILRGSNYDSMCESHIRQLLSITI